MLFVFILADSCKLLNAVNATVEPEYANIYTTVTKHGLEGFIRENLRFFEEEVILMKIPNQAFDAFGFLFQLLDMHVVDILAHDFNIELFDNDLVQFSLTNMSLRLELRYTAQEAIYPYLSDGGEGTIVLDGFHVFTEFEVRVSETCFGHIAINPHNMITHIDALKVSLTGDLGFLYDSFFSALTDILLNVLNPMMNKLMYDMLKTDANYALGRLYPFSWSTFSNTIDQRWLSVGTRTNLIFFSSPGVVCPSTGNRFDCTTPVPDNKKQLPAYTQNANMQIMIHVDSFKTNDFVINLKYGNQFRLASKEYSNTGLVVSVFTPDNQTEINANCHFEAHPTTNSNGAPLTTNVAAGNCTKFGCSGALCQDAAAVEQLVLQVSQALKEAPITYNMVSMSHECYVVSVSREWIDAVCNVPV